MIRQAFFVGICVASLCMALSDTPSLLDLSGALGDMAEERLVISGGGAQRAAGGQGNWQHDPDAVEDTMDFMIGLFIVCGVGVLIYLVCKYNNEKYH